MTKQTNTIAAKLRAWFIPDTKLHLLSALLLTVFTLYRIVCECGWMDETEIYKEFTVTYATWFGVNKTAELRIMNLLALGMPLLFLGYGFLLNRWRIVCEKLPQAELLPFIVILMLWIGRYQYGSICTTASIATIAYYLTVSENASPDTIKQVSVTILLHQFTAQIIGQGVYCFLGTDRMEILPEILGFSLLIVDLLAAVFIKATPQRTAMGLRHAQLLIPLAFAYVWRFPYVQPDDTIVYGYYSLPLMVLCLAICAVLLAVTTYNIRHRKTGLWLTTALGAAAAMGYCIPSYGILTDWFHFGEYAITAQQLFHYGSLPYFDFYPIHGICDYVYSVAATVFYDGSLASLSAGVVIGNLFAICAAAAVIWCVAKEKTGATLLFLMLLNPMIFTAQGYNYIIRWLVAFLTVFVLNSARIRHHAIASIYWWIWLSMLGILWNPAIGGAVAIAFIPVLLRRSLCKEGREQWVSLKEKAVLKPWIIRAVPLLICGLCYIPVFLHIVQYILENTGTTTATNGSAMLNPTDLESASTALSWLRKFAAPLFIGLLTLLWCSCGKRTARGEILDSLLLTVCATPLVANYIYVRYDDGDRAMFYWMLLAVCVIVPLLGTVFKTTDALPRKRQIIALGGIVICFSFAICDLLPMLSPNLQCETGTMPTDTALIQGEAEGIPNLGNGLLPEYKAQLATDYAALCAAICTDEDDVVFNGTTHIGLTVMMDQKLATKYTSLYNISNARMQENALEQLKENPPKLVLLQNGVLIDEMTTSMRCFPIYTWLLEEGYVPYTYGGLLFMTKESTVPEGAQRNWQRFFSAMTPDDLRLLPKVWANAEAADDLVHCTASATPSRIEALGVTAYCTLEFSEPLQGKECDFIALNFNGIADGTQGRLSFDYDACGLQGTEEFSFTVSDGTMLIPTSIAPAWYLSDAIPTVQLRFRAEDIDSISDQFSVEAHLLAYPNA